MLQYNTKLERLQLVGDARQQMLSRTAKAPQPSSRKTPSSYCTRCSTQPGHTECAGRCHRGCARLPAASTSLRLVDIHNVRFAGQLATNLQRSQLISTAPAARCGGLHVCHSMWVEMSVHVFVASRPRSMLQLLQSRPWPPLTCNSILHGLSQAVAQDPCEWSQAWSARICKLLHTKHQSLLRVWVPVSGASQHPDSGMGVEISLSMKPGSRHRLEHPWFIKTHG